jgi:large exoprotein involved in heme utilization and adhesion
VQTSAAASAGGNIEVAVGDSVLLRNSSISAEAGGVTATDTGGNVTIDPDWVVLDESQIVARANAGNGGNIFIQSGFFIASAGTVLDASSSQGIDGNVLIDSPNQITGTVLPLDTPPTDVDALARQRCVPQLEAQRSSLTVAQRIDINAAPGNYLSSPPVAPPPVASRNGGATDPGTELLAVADGCR